jgi:CheY-like chemotaxis protein
MPKILLVDDDSELVAMLTTYLEREGFEVGAAYDGQTGAADALSGQYFDRGDRCDDAAFQRHRGFDADSRPEPDSSADADRQG